MEASGGKRRDKTAAVLKGERAIQARNGSPRAQLPQPRFSDQMHPGQGGAIQQRQLRSVHPDGRLGEASASQRGQQMFHCRQATPAQVESRAEGGLADLARLQALQRRIGSIEPPDPEPRSGGRCQTYPGHGSAVQPDSLNLRTSGQSPAGGVVGRPVNH